MHQNGKHLRHQDDVIKHAVWSTECQPRRTPIVTYGKKNTQPVDLRSFLSSFYTARVDVHQSRSDQCHLFASPASYVPPLGSSSGLESSQEPSQSDSEASIHQTYSLRTKYTVCPGLAQGTAFHDTARSSFDESVTSSSSSTSTSGRLPLITVKHPGVVSIGTTRAGCHESIEEMPCLSRTNGPSISDSKEPRCGLRTPLTTLRRRLKSVQLVPRKLWKPRAASKDVFGWSNRGDGFSKGERILTYKVKPRQQPLRLRTNPSIPSKTRTLMLSYGLLPDVVFDSCDVRDSHGGRNGTMVKLTNRQHVTRHPKQKSRNHGKHVVQSPSEVIRDASCDIRSNLTEENLFYTGPGSAEHNSEPVVNERASALGGQVESMSDIPACFKGASSDSLHMLGTPPIAFPLESREKRVAGIPPIQRNTIPATVCGRLPSLENPAQTPSSYEERLLDHESEGRMDSSTRDIIYENGLVTDAGLHSTKSQRQQSILNDGRLLQPRQLPPGAIAENMA